MAAPLSCPQKVDCRGQDYPISNYSAELDDSLVYVGLAWPGGTDNGSPPALGSNWTVRGCFGVAEAETQAEAVELAIQLTRDCGMPPQDGPAYSTPPGVPGPLDRGVPNGPSQIPITSGRGGGVGTESFCNVEARAESNQCPPGTCDSIAIIPPCTIKARTQGLADLAAQELASTQSAANYLCAPDISADYCVGDVLGDTLSLIGANPPLFLDLIGAPDNMAAAAYDDTTAFISGTLSTPGVYSVTAKLSDVLGHSNTCQGTVRVLGITNLPLPSGQCSQAYSYQLEADGGTAPYTFAVASGVFPTGISMTASGLISGTANTCSVEDLTFRVTDADGRTCNPQASNLEIIGPCYSPLSLVGHGFWVPCPGETDTFSIGTDGTKVASTKVFYCTGTQIRINEELIFFGPQTKKACGYPFPPTLITSEARVTLSWGPTGTEHVIHNSAVNHSGYVESHTIALVSGDMIVIALLQNGGADSNGATYHVTLEEL